MAESRILTILYEEHNFFWHQAERQSEEDVLLSDSWERSSQRSADVVLDS